jgi:hypothetical protein
MKNFMWLWIGSLLLAAQINWAGDLKLAAKSVSEKYHQSVVTVRVVIRLKQNYMGQTRDQEQKLELNGTIIDPSGLTITSASAIDPASSYRMMTQMNNQFKIESEVKETNLLLEDGTEVEADIVLKDTNLDMAFIKPREANQNFPPIVLKPFGKPLQMLDELLIISRLGKVGNRSILVSTAQVGAWVKGPRPFYVCNESLGAAVGCLAFNDEGVPVGIFLTKQVQDGGDGAGMARRRPGDLSLTVLRPVEDLMEIADQARQVRAAALSPKN